MSSSSVQFAGDDRSPSAMPVRKVGASAIAGVILAVLLCFVNSFSDELRKTSFAFLALPEFASFLTAAVQFIVGYFTPPAPAEVSPTETFTVARTRFNVPTRKVGASAVVGLASSVTICAFQSDGGNLGQYVSPALASLITTALSFATAYVTPSAKGATVAKQA
jgi:hypothetical protein